MHVAGKAQVHALVREERGDIVGVLHDHLAAQQPEQRHARQQRIVAHRDHGLAVLPRLFGLLQDPLDLPRGVGVVLFAVAVVIQGQQPQTGRELRHVRKIFAVHRNGVRKAEFIVKVKQLFPLRALRLQAAGLVEGKGMVVEIVPGGDHEDALAVGLQILQQLDKAQMALLFAVERKVARDQHRIGQIGAVQKAEGRFVDLLRFGEALLLVFHEFFVRFATAAELFGEIMGIRNQKKPEFAHGSPPF